MFSANFWCKLLVVNKFSTNLAKSSLIAAVSLLFTSALIGVVNNSLSWGCSFDLRFGWTAFLLGDLKSLSLALFTFSFNGVLIQFFDPSEKFATWKKRFSLEKVLMSFFKLFEFSWKNEYFLGNSWCGITTSTSLDGLRTSLVT